MDLRLTNRLPVSESVIETDQSKIESIFTNLIKNAIKFTEKGSIEISCDIVESKLLFYVKDSGLGISKDMHESVFSRFVQVDDTSTRAIGGSGLGLAITKAYVEMLGGEIWLDSEEDKGSTFYFTIPRKKAEVKKGRPKEDSKGSDMAISEDGIKIMIAEDDLPSFLHFSLLLEHTNIEIIHAWNGKEALSYCKQHPDLSLIFMDIKMPDMDGLTATRKIREFNKEIVIIGQSAYALEGDTDKAIAAGCNEYITKPINEDIVEKLLEKYTP